jgi:hypothetical protein
MFGKKQKKEQSQENISIPLSEIKTMNYLIPIWAIGRERPERFRYLTTLKLATDYRKRYNRPSSIRQLLASDLGLQSWRTPPQNPKEKSVWVNCTVPFNTSLAIIGVTQLSKNPKLSKVTIAIGAASNVIIGLHELDQLYAALPVFEVLEKFQDDKSFSEIRDLECLKMTGFFSAPYFYKEGEIINISVESPEGNESGDKLMLNGFIAEMPEDKIAV